MIKMAVMALVVAAFVLLTITAFTKMAIDLVIYVFVFILLFVAYKIYQFGRRSKN